MAPLECGCRAHGRKGRHRARPLHGCGDASGTGETRSPLRYGSSAVGQDATTATALVWDCCEPGYHAPSATGPTEVKLIEEDRGETADRRDVFISHASEDKDAIARPLAEQLQQCGYSVWFDEYELMLGDSLRDRIGNGLRHSQVGVVVLSKNFFAKQWPKWELDGLTERQIAGEPNVILPVWHEVGADDVRSYSLPLGNVVAVRSSDGVEDVAESIIRVLETRRAGGAPKAALSQALVSPAAATPLAEATPPSAGRANVPPAREPTARRFQPSELRFWRPKPRDPGWVRALDRRFISKLTLFAVLFILSYFVGAAP